MNTTSTSQSIVQPNLDQEEHDRRMAKQTPEQRKAMVKGLGALARSELMNEPSSSSTESGALSKAK